MVRLQTLDLRIGVRVPASQPTLLNILKAVGRMKREFRVPGIASTDMDERRQITADAPNVNEQGANLVCDEERTQVKEGRRRAFV